MCSLKMSTPRRTPKSTGSGSGVKVGGRSPCSGQPVFETLSLPGRRGPRAFDRAVVRADAAMDLNSQEFYGGGLKEGEVSTGTTIMAVAYDGGVIMGADSRVSTGTYIANRVSDKVSHLHDKIFMCRSGSAADTQAVSDYVRHYLGSHAIEVGKPPLVKTAANLAKRICYTNKEQLLAGVIVAGHDDADGGSVYVIPLGGARPRPPFAFSARARATPTPRRRRHVPQGALRHRRLRVDLHLRPRRPHLQAEHEPRGVQGLRQGGRHARDVPRRLLGRHHPPRLHQRRRRRARVPHRLGARPPGPTRPPPVVVLHT